MPFAQDKCFLTQLTKFKIIFFLTYPKRIVWNGFGKKFYSETYGQVTNIFLNLFRIPSYNEGIPIVQCNGHFRTVCPMGPMGKNNMVNGKLFLLAFFHIYVYITEFKFIGKIQSQTNIFLKSSVPAHFIWTFFKK